MSIEPVYVRREKTREIISLLPDQFIARKGEGTVYGWSNPGRLKPANPATSPVFNTPADALVSPSKYEYAAKIYHKEKQTPERAAKLKYMIANPPRIKPSSETHFPLAWPQERLLDPKTNSPIGFLMPYISSRPIHEVCDPGTRGSDFDYRHSHYAAYNLAAIVASLHRTGEYVIADLNLTNVAVADAALVSLWDCDSFQVQEKGGNLHRSRMAHHDHISPELIGNNAAATQPRTTSQDDFSLAVLLYRLLMQGWHPYAFVPVGFDEEITRLEAMRLGYFVNHPEANERWRSPEHAPIFSVLPPKIRDMFVRCFTPNCERPTAQEWKEVLKQFLGEDSIRPCKRNAAHFYYNHLNQCPWCAAEIDPYLSVVIAQGAKPTITFTESRSTKVSMVPMTSPETSIPPIPQAGTSAVPSVAPLSLMGNTLELRSGPSSKPEVSLASSSSEPDNTSPPEMSVRDSVLLAGNGKQQVRRHLIVAQDGTGSHRTISEALASAVDSPFKQHIHIRPGLYDEAIEIRQAVILEADMGVVLQAPIGAAAIRMMGDRASLTLHGLVVQQAPAPSSSAPPRSAAAPIVGLLQMTAGSQLRLEQCRFYGGNVPSLVVSSAKSRVQLLDTWIEANAIAIIVEDALHLEMTNGAIAGSPEIGVHFDSEANPSYGLFRNVRFKGIRRTAVLASSTQAELNFEKCVLEGANSNVKLVIQNGQGKVIVR